MKAVTINTQGEKAVVDFDLGKSYDVLRKAVGGYIECVYLYERGIDMWVNEEGKLLGFDQNPIGTALWAESYGLTDVIMGDIIFTGGTDEDGETLGLEEYQVEALLQYDRAIHLLS